VARRYLQDCYGVTNSPVHAGLPTDRLVAEWWLDSERVRGILADNPAPAKGQLERITIPSSVSEMKMNDRAAGLRIQSATRAQFEQWFSKGYVASGIENRGDSTDYLLEPSASIAGLRLEDSDED
jgi:predicted GNAT superfamily acetyltransferase